ncbi:SDR family oxidoreductase [Defluviimonas sp. WL0002]|uniref:SDR family oxidoreductase n=1 Tax=Albidovulum marisflavi TaxID=2984159 RepID=A0ABT2ZCK1_9RHOB|nr:SDR family oxidoreductase [Defluviimonas sp. WL0002]MCV2868839.1 SDR family oxidoreductase [Defluviimonas sp. WL0002]
MPRSTEEQQRQVQRSVEADGDGGGPAGPMQAGARLYPEPPFPAQRQEKPGFEAGLDPAPMWEAPYYRGSGKLADKIALVTGGDSGIGRAVAVLFAREGADVAFSHLSEEEIDARVTQQAIEQEGRRCLVLQGDVSDRDTCQQHAEMVAQMFGRIDILVNNAAFQVHRTDFADLSPAQFELTLRTNLFGYFYMAQAVLPFMPHGGAIVNTGSVTGLRGSSELVDYSMTKGGIHAFTRALSGNLLDRGIRVNAVAPGPVWTPLNPSDRPAEEVARFGAKSRMGRPAQPEELAPAYVFLASAQCSSYISGEILPVIGGY